MELKHQRFLSRETQVKRRSRLQLKQCVFGRNR